MSLRPFPWTGLGGTRRKQLHQQPHSRTHGERDVRGFDATRTGGERGRERSGKKRGKVNGRQDALRKGLKWP